MHQRRESMKDTRRLERTDWARQDQLRRQTEESLERMKESRERLEKALRRPT